MIPYKGRNCSCGFPFHRIARARVAVDLFAVLQEKLKDLQERLAFQVKQTRKIVLPTFQDFDKRRT